MLTDGEIGEGSVMDTDLRRDILPKLSLDEDCLSPSLSPFLEKVFLILLKKLPPLAFVDEGRLFSRKGKSLAS